MSKVSNVITMLELLQSGRKYSINELSNKLEVSERMIRVYKEDLKKVGIYIDTIMGPYGGYVLNQSANMPVRKFKMKDAKLLDRYIANEKDKDIKDELILLQDKIKGVYIGSKQEEKELNLKDEKSKKYNLLTTAIKEKTQFNYDLKSDVYEIFSGYDTSTASKYLESTMVESGIGIPIVHDKYSYCHGRSTFGINYSGNIIYFNRNTEFDKMMLEELKKYYSRIITINSKFEDQILDDYQMLIQCMYLTKHIAEKKSKDLSKVDYSPIVKKLYKYKGQI